MAEKLERKPQVHEDERRIHRLQPRWEDFVAYGSIERCQ